MNPKTGSWLPAFLALAVIWGCSFALIRLSLDALTPVQVAFWRLFLGAVALTIAVAATGRRLPRSARTWGHLAVVGGLLNSVPFTLFAFGQQYVSSVLAGIINAATPLAVLVVILAAFPEEQPTRERVAGLLTGFLGVTVVIGFWRGFSGSQSTGILACLGAIGCYGVAFPYARRYLSTTNDGPVALAAGQVLVATAQMLPVLLLIGVAPRDDLTPIVVGSIAALGVLGSGVAYILNFHVIATRGATTASTVTYLTPLVAAVVGVAFLDETISWNEPIGGLIVLAGIAIAQQRLRAFRLRNLVPRLFLAKRTDASR